MVSGGSTTGPFHFSHSVDYTYECCPLPNPDVGPSIFVCDVEHTFFHFGLCGRKFVLCLFGQCPGLCTICHSWQHTGVVHLSLQADGKVAFEDIPVFGVCRPACHALHAGFHGLPFHAGQCGLVGGTEIGVPSLGSCVSAVKGSTCPAT